MDIRKLISLALAVTLLSTLASATSPGPFGSSGPIGGVSKGDIVAAVAGAAAVVVVTVLLIRHATHKHSTIMGCVNSGASGFILASDKHGKSYALSGDLSSIKDGERVALKGTMTNGENGKNFAIEKVTRDYGACPART